MKKLIKVGLWVVVIGFLLVQLVPNGRRHHNPPIVREPNWDNAETRALAQRACFDCHSHETVWPWYSQVAPVSWLIQKDANEGRQMLNFSDWGKGREGEKPEELVKSIREGEMPLKIYLPLHPEVRLSDSERAALIMGFERMTSTVLSTKAAETMADPQTDLEELSENELDND